LHPVTECHRHDIQNLSRNAAMSFPNRQGLTPKGEHPMRIGMPLITAIVAIGFSAGTLATDLSTLTNEQLLELSPAQMADDERHAFRGEVRSRMSRMEDSERQEFRDRMRQQFERDGEQAGRAMGRGEGRGRGHSEGEGRGQGRGQGGGEGGARHRRGQGGGG
jgi:hypothetical protein